MILLKCIYLHIQQIIVHEKIRYFLMNKKDLENRINWTNCLTKIVLKLAIIV